MALTSKLFTEPPNKKLNDCAKNDPDHIMQGVNDQGDHVGRIQTALLRLRTSEPDLQLPAIGIEELGNQKYGEKTAACVLKYKQKRGIINPRYQQKADNIVGIMTIASLDKDMAKIKPSIPTPQQPPPPPPPAAPSIRRITFREFNQFEATPINFLDPTPNDFPADLFGALADIAGISDGKLQTFENKPNRRIASISAEHRVNQFTISVDIKFEFLKKGQGTITFTDTTFEYQWGPPLPNVTIQKNFSSKVFDEKKKTFPPEFQRVPRGAAEKMPNVVPPSVP